MEGGKPIGKLFPVSRHGLINLIVYFYLNLRTNLLLYSERTYFVEAFHKFNFSGTLGSGLYGIILQNRVHHIYFIDKTTNYFVKLMIDFIQKTMKNRTFYARATTFEPVLHMQYM